MVKIQTIGLAVVVIFVVGALAFLARRRYLSKLDSNDNTGTERISQAEKRRSGGVPYRSRVAKMPLPVKVLLASTLLLAFIIAFNIYQYFKTGSPMQAVYATEAQMVLLGILCAGGGMWLYRKFSQQYRTATIVHEPSTENDLEEQYVEEFPFDPGDIKNTDDGTIIHECDDNLILGMFRRPRLVGEDRKLRNDSELYRPPEDKIEHGVPSWAIERPNGDYFWRTSEKEVNSSAEVPADYEYASPFILDRSQYKKIRAEKQEMIIEINELNGLVARLYQSIENLEQENENKSEESIEEALALIDKVRGLVNDSPTHHNYQEVNTPSHAGTNGTVGKQQERPSQQMESQAES